MSLDIRAGIKRLVCFQGGKDRNAADYKYGIITRNAPNCGLFSFIITYMGGNTVMSGKRTDSGYGFAEL